MATGPRINGEFPIKEPTQLSPPIVGSPIHQCAEIVSVSGFVPHATVRVYANLTDLVGEDAPPFGFADIRLTRGLSPGESITATQTVNNLTSTHSIAPVVVSAYVPGHPDLPKPVVAEDIYACGHVVPVGDLVPSVTVHVLEEGSEIGAAAAAGTGVPVVTAPLDAGRKVTATQVLCEHTPASTLKSPASNPVTVKASPDPVPHPDVDKQSLIAGNDAVTLTGLYCGAEVSVLDHTTAIGGGYATGSANWCPVDPPLQATSAVSATQALCVESKASDPVTPGASLTAPVVVGPICAGARVVIIRQTTVNANVILRRGGAIIGYGGAVPGDLVLAIGGNAHLNAGDVITAVQTMGSSARPRTPSPSSASWRSRRSRSWEASRSSCPRPPIRLSTRRCFRAAAARGR